MRLRLDFWLAMKTVEEIKLATGEFIVVKSFFSATIDLNVALAFTGFHGTETKDEKLFVLFEITVDLSVKHAVKDLEISSN